ncbi:MAG: carboxylesterase family protein [Pseudomonas sp.]
MRSNNQPSTSRFILSSLSAVVLAVSLSGCLSSGGGGSSSSDPAPHPADPLQIETTTGEFRGIELNGQRVFRGIPYAKPPVGDLRLAVTEPADKLEGVQELSVEFGNECPQSSATTGAAAGDEDCLYLNVYAPAEGEDLPVMVWMHGGAFILGSGGGEYDPTRLVEKDVIVVTFNYRLGLLGFLAHPGLEHDGGNFGLMDQQEALRWVKQNIASFGGDPENVTIFGESAGGHSVLSHIVSPRAQEEGLFNKAIIQSGSYAPTQIPKAFANPLAQMQFAATCADFASTRECINSLSVEQILTLQDGQQSIPTVDPAGDLLPKSVATALAEGAFDTNLDIMIGSNQDEGTLFVALDELANGLVPLTDEATFREEVMTLVAPFGINGNAVADHYLAEFPEGTPSRLSLALAAVWTDYMFACNSRSHAEAFADVGVDTFNYWFTDVNAPWTMIPPAIPTPVGMVPFSFPFGATHAGEIPYVLYPEATMRERYSGDQADVDKLAGYMIDYWTNFAKYGDPNSTEGTSPVWPTFNTAQQALRLDVEPKTETAATFNNYHRCGYWATVPTP